MNTLDDEITRIMEEAEATLQAFLNHWWWDTLHQAFKVAEYWKIFISFQRNCIQDSQVLLERRTKIDPTIDIYQGDKKRKPTGQLRKMLKYLKQCRNNSRTLRDEYQQQKATEEATTDNKKETSNIVKRVQNHKAMI
eukprot:5140721-Ditylum_brightwellii.AAC.1